MTEDSVTDSDESANEPSAPSDLCVQVRGYEESLARDVANRIHIIIREASRVLPLANLDGVTIGYDYQEALDSINRGFGSANHITRPTEDSELGAGVAMALPVRRGDTMKTHIVCGYTVFDLLNSDSDTDSRSAYKLLLHELGHAVDHEYKFRASREFGFQNIDEVFPDPLDRYLWELGSHIWDEYCANRIAGIFFPEGYQEEELFIRTQSVFRKRIYEARALYRDREIDLDSFLEIVRNNFRIMLLATGYLLGLNDAQDDATSPAPKATELLLSAECQELLAYQEVLRDLWSKRDQWTGYDVFLALNEPTLSLLHSLELYPSRTADDGLYMDVPIRF